MRLLKIRNCSVILLITVRGSSKRRGLIMLKQLVALLHLMTSGGFATAFLKGGSLPYFFFLMAQRSWQHLLTKLTSLLGIFHAIPLVKFPNSFPIFHLVLNRDLALRGPPPKWFLISIYDFGASKATGPETIPAIVFKMCSSGLCWAIQQLLGRSCFSFCWKFSSVVPSFKNDGERSDPGGYRHISLVRSLSLLLMIVWLNILALLSSSLTFSMVFVLSGLLLTFWLFSVSVFTTRWMQVERQGLFHLTS